MTTYLSNFGLVAVLSCYSLFSSAQGSVDHANDLVKRAHELIGTPYQWGGNSAKQGFDCSGLLVYLFKSEADIKLPRTSSSMFSAKAKTVSRSDLKRGDAVFFKHGGRRKVSHVGLYIGGGRFIHAPRRGKTVRIESLDNIYWNKNYVSAKRW